MLEVMQQINLLFIPFLVAGVILLVIEMITPGFGAAGFSGLLCLVAGIVVGAKNLATALILTIFVLLILAILVVVFLVLISCGKIPAPLILKKSESKTDGFVSGADYSAILGKVAKTQTPLRPSGKAEIENQVYDVVSLGEFIDKGKEVEVVAVNSNRIVVKER